jgi:hypothetical protein
VIVTMALPLYLETGCGENAGIMEKELFRLRCRQTGLPHSGKHITYGKDGSSIGASYTAERKTEQTGIEVKKQP